MFSEHGTAICASGVGPRQQLVDSAHRPAIDEAGENAGEVELRVDSVELCCFDQRGDDPPMHGAAIVTGEECIFSVQRDRPDGALNGIRVDFDATIIKKERQALPMADGIAQRLCHFGFARNTLEIFVEKGLERFNARPALGLANAMAHLGALASDLFLDCVKGRDLAQRVFAKRRVAALRDVVEPPPAMRPTCVRLSPGKENGM